MFRILLYGIIRTIRPQGPLDGLLGGRFIVAFLSVLCILGAKGLFIAMVLGLYSHPRWIGNGGSWKTQPSLSTITQIIALQFVPQFILSFFTTIGFSSSSMKLILYHPETLLLSSGKRYTLKMVNQKNY